jgi:hypothetical protein
MMKNKATTRLQTGRFEGNVLDFLDLGFIGLWFAANFDIWISDFHIKVWLD